LPTEPPRVALEAELAPALEQSGAIEERRAELVGKSRRSIELYWTIPIVPA